VTLLGIRCERLSKRFNGLKALREVSLSLPRPGIVGVVGPNGSGKTTLLNVLTGFLAPDEGRWFIDEKEGTRRPPYAIARLGVSRSFQDVRLAGRVTVLENLLLALSPLNRETIGAALIGFFRKELRREQSLVKSALELLHVVGLGEMAKHEARALSYGQRKLLALACCMARETEVILLDEPLAGVHPELIGRIIGLMQGLASEGKLIVFVEHDLDSVRSVADQVVAMNAGRVLAQGATAEVLGQSDLFRAYTGS
jgi:branched-chain amino acid transport system ATP-binding protein